MTSLRRFLRVQVESSLLFLVSSTDLAPDGYQGLLTTAFRGTTPSARPLPCFRGTLVGLVHTRRNVSRPAAEQRVSQALLGRAVLWNSMKPSASLLLYGSSPHLCVVLGARRGCSRASWSLSLLTVAIGTVPHESTATCRHVSHQPTARQELFDARSSSDLDQTSCHELLEDWIDSLYELRGISASWPITTGNTLPPMVSLRTHVQSLQPDACRPTQGNLHQDGCRYGSCLHSPEAC